MYKPFLSEWKDYVWNLYNEILFTTEPVLPGRLNNSLLYTTNSYSSFTFLRPRCNRNVKYNGVRFKSLKQCNLGNKEHYGHKFIWNIRSDFVSIVSEISDIKNILGKLHFEIQLFEECETFNFFKSFYLHKCNSPV